MRSKEWEHVLWMESGIHLCHKQMQKNQSTKNSLKVFHIKKFMVSFTLKFSVFSVVYKYHVDIDYAILGTYIFSVKYKLIVMRLTKLHILFLHKQTFVTSLFWNVHHSFRSRKKIEKGQDCPSYLSWYFLPMKQKMYMERWESKSGYSSLWTGMLRSANKHS